LRKPRRKKHPFPLLTRYLGDWRSLLPGGAAGVLQLMYPPLGAAVAKQSDFFDDPFGRVYRSIPQIWATILAPDGAERAVKIRDVHKSIKGVAPDGRRYSALHPETYWWAHATFTWEVFESIRLFHHGGLKRLDREALYAETVAWYRLYSVAQSPVPATYAAFQEKFARICATQLEMTPAATRVLEMGYAGAWRPPLIRGNFRNPLIRHFGRTALLGTIPSPVRRRFDIPWRLRDATEFRAMCTAIREGTRLIPNTANNQSLEMVLRFVGNKTKTERYSPAASVR
jgi:uncharacterized protein (DUF2236 family)